MILLYNDITLTVTQLFNVRQSLSMTASSYNFLYNGILAQKSRSVTLDSTVTPG